MGYMRHHAILVTSWDKKGLGKAHTQAAELFGDDQLSPVLGPVVNGYFSFVIAPDGSKEGWDDSETGDGHRTQFVTYLRSQVNEDGGSALQWVEVMYGDDEGDAAIVNHSGQESNNG